MKKLVIILVIFAFFGCTKEEIKPTEQEKDVIENKDVIKDTIYILTFEYNNIINHQSYARNESEIIYICSGMLSKYKAFEIIEIDYIMGYVYCIVLNGNVWESVALKLYSFDSL